MAMQAVDTLMDSGSTREQQAVIVAVNRVKGITDVRDVRLRSSGPTSFVDLTVGVEPGIKVSEGHRLAHEAEQAVELVLEGGGRDRPCGAAQRRCRQTLRSLCTGAVYSLESRPFRA